MVITRQYIDEHYWKGKKSIHVIADALGTYPNKIRRAIMAEFGSLRTKSEAQKAALKSGTSKHPTEGRERTDTEKLNISKSVATNWGGISEAEREKRSKFQYQMDKQAKRSKAHTSLERAKEFVFEMKKLL